MPSHQCQSTEGNKRTQRSDENTRHAQPHLAVLFLGWRQVSTDTIFLRHVVDEDKLLIHREIRRLLRTSAVTRRLMTNLPPVLHTLGHHLPISTNQTSSNHPSNTGLIANCISGTVNKSRFLYLQPDSGWLTVMLCNQPVDEEQPTGLH